MKLDQLTPLVRHAMQVLAGGLVAGGYINDETAIGVVGLGVSLFTLLWYRYSASRAALAVNESPKP